MRAVVAREPRRRREARPLEEPGPGRPRALRRAAGPTPSATAPPAMAAPPRNTRRFMTSCRGHPPRPPRAPSRRAAGSSPVSNTHPRRPDASAGGAPVLLSSARLRAHLIGCACLVRVVSFVFAALGLGSLVVRLPRASGGGRARARRGGVARRGRRAADARGLHASERRHGHPRGEPRHAGRRAAGVDRGRLVARARGSARRGSPHGAHRPRWSAGRGGRGGLHGLDDVRRDGLRNGRRGAARARAARRPRRDARARRASTSAEIERQRAATSLGELGRAAASLGRR